MRSWIFSEAECRLASGDDIAHLTPKAAAVLGCLVRQRGKILSREELLSEVWNGLHVTPDLVREYIFDLRSVLSDDAKAPTYIETVHRKGFRLIGDVQLAPTQSLPAKPSIAVLALGDLSVGEDQGYLGDAIGEGIITELSRFSELFVIARNSSFQYRNKAKDVRDIAKELGVHYVLEGSQQKDGDRLRVTVQLIDALKGSHIWAETYDRDLADIFAVQDEIVRMVASRVGGEIAFRPPPTGGLARLNAMEYHLKARQYVRQHTPEGAEQARLLNLKAIDADPTSPFGYLGLAFVYGQGFNYGWTELSPEQALERAAEAAEKALELDSYNYDTQYARAFVHLQAGEPNLAITRFEKAIELNPSATNVMATMSESLVFAGRIDEAIELLHRAIRLDPHHPVWFKWTLAWSQWAADDCDAALVTYESMARTINEARRTLAAIYIRLNRQEEAEATIAKLLENKPGHTISDVRRAMSAKAGSDPKRVMERFIDDLRAAGLPE